MLLAALRFKWIDLCDYISVLYDHLSVHISWKFSFKHVTSGKTIPWRLLLKLKMDQLREAECKCGCAKASALLFTCFVCIHTKSILLLSALQTVIVTQALYLIGYAAGGDGGVLARTIRLAARTLEPLPLESPKFLTSFLYPLDKLWRNFR